MMVCSTLLIMALWYYIFYCFPFLFSFCFIVTFLGFQLLFCILDFLGRFQGIVLSMVFKPLIGTVF